jgi:hypothetical protein
MNLSFSNRVPYFSNTKCRILGLLTVTCHFAILEQEDYLAYWTMPLVLNSNDVAT